MKTRPEAWLERHEIVIAESKSQRLIAIGRPRRASCEIRDNKMIVVFMTFLRGITRKATT